MPPTLNKRSTSPNQEAETSPTDKPKLRFLEFDSSSPSASHTQLSSPPPPPPPPPPSETKKPTSAFSPVHSSPNQIRVHPPKLAFTRPNRKSISPPLPSTLPETILEEPPEPSGDFGIKPRSKLNGSVDQTTPTPPVLPLLPESLVLLPDLAPYIPGAPYIPPPPPLPPLITPKRKPQARYAKRGNPSPPLSHNFAPSNPAKPSQPYSPSLKPLPQQQTRVTTSQSAPRLLPLSPSDSSPGFSLPRTIRKSSEAFQLKIRSRLTKSGTSALMPQSSKQVKPTSIFGSYEPEQEESEFKINLESLVLVGVHELGPESLMSIGNLIGAHIRSIDLSFCPIGDRVVGEFAKLCPNLRHLALRFVLPFISFLCFPFLPSP